MGRITKPDLGIDYSGIDTIKKYVEMAKKDSPWSYVEDTLDFVLWILDDYIKLKQGSNTNFERITASPEALAEFVQKSHMLHSRCDVIYPNCEDCKCEYCGNNGKPSLLEWLKQESDTE